MSAPFADIGCVRTPLSCSRGAHPITTRRHKARTVSPAVELPNRHDAARHRASSGVSGPAVGGVCVGAVHGRSVRAHHSFENHHVF